MKQYKPVNIDNKVIIKFDLTGSEHGEMNIGIVECEDGFRAYIMKGNAEQASIGASSFKEALNKIVEIDDTTESKMNFVETV